ncbi:cytochrome c peroxidase [Cupriavidus basilensis]
MAQWGTGQMRPGTALSVSGKQSCATCHVESRAHAANDGLAVPLGGPGMDLPGFRNAPSLVYAQFTPAFSFQPDGTPVGGLFRDGRADLACRPGRASPS